MAAAVSMTGHDTGRAGSCCVLWRRNFPPGNSRVPSREKSTDVDSKSAASLEVLGKVRALAPSVALSSLCDEVVEEEEEDICSRGVRNSN